jgi:hypothetical protein
MHKEYGPQGLKVLAVNAWDEPKAAVEKFMREQKLTHHILLDGGSVAGSKYNVAALPTTFWIHKDGTVVRQTSGGNGKDTKDMEAWIRGMIKAE